MEGIDDVRIVQINGRGLIGDVDRMVQGQVPHRERLELGVAGLHPVLMLVIELRQARGKLARAGTGGGHHNQRASGLDKLVLTVAVLGNDEVDVVRVALDGIVQLAGDAQVRKAVAEHVRGGLAGILGQHHAGDAKTVRAEDVGQTKHVLVVRDAQIATSLVLLNVVGVDGDDDLDIVHQLLEHAELGVGFKAGKDAGSMVVIKQLAAKLKVELAAQLVDTFADLLGLQLDVLLVIKTLTHAHMLLPAYQSVTPALYRSLGGQPPRTRPLTAFTHRPPT